MAKDPIAPLISLVLAWQGFRHAQCLGKDNADTIQCGRGGVGRGTNAILFYNVEVMGVTWIPLYRIAKLIYKLKHLGSMLNPKDLRVAISCCKEIKTVNLN